MSCASPVRCSPSAPEFLPPTQYLQNRVAQTRSSWCYQMSRNHHQSLAANVSPILYNLRSVAFVLRTLECPINCQDGSKVSLLIRKATIDDTMRRALEELLLRGESITPSKGNCRELRGVLLELTNPRARLSRSESRGNAFSSLGELCWYLSGSSDIKFIEYYIPSYRKFAENGILHGAYGPRLLKMRGVINQINNVISILKRKRSSRRAIMQLFNAEDVIEEHKDIPCTCTFQFLIRSDHLEMITNMRSNDAYVGLPHDVFCFTMIQEIVARHLDVEPGVYRHIVGSLHLYDCNVDGARKVLG